MAEIRNVYPWFLEDSLARLYIKEINRLNKKYIPKILKQYSLDIDKILQVDKEISDIFTDFENESNLDIVDVLLIMAVFSASLNTFQHTNFIKNVELATFNTVFSVPIIPKNGVISRSVLKEFEDLNSKLIKTITIENFKNIKDKTLDVIGRQLEQLTTRAITKAQSIQQLSREIQKTISITKSKADFWARDQLKLYNGKLEKARLKEANIPGYVWTTVGDGRVRPSHRAKHGRFFKDGETSPEPGQAYLCRCTRFPAFSRAEQPSISKIKKDVAFMIRDAKNITLVNKNVSLNKKISRIKKFKTISKQQKIKQIAQTQKAIKDNARRIKR